ncbi:homoserine kinase [Nesterenkonia marinintestina]|uniref:homoserine kinase n=1 Tax=Nesterenkonia marinintestina TaxID=2979865 RepID=UPI0021C1FB8C|nr:homoserine kinase [Nesterenkonia sp. GX14115]
MLHTDDAAAESELPDPVAGPTAFRVSVPATSANLGPGYDCMGLALELRDVVDVEARPRSDARQASVSVDVVGESAEDLPTDATHLIVVLIARILRSRGFRLPDLSLRATNSIPHGRGLGSSAAAAACAVTAAAELLPDGLSPDEQLQIGARFEGHPDNYVPALRGGAAVSWEQDGHFDGAPLRLDPGVRAVAAIPDFRQSTAAARVSLPDTVPHAEAAANSARAALLVHALTAEPSRLCDATADLLHQEQRRPHFPSSMALVDRLRGEGHAAVISGAGPTVLVLADGDDAAESALTALEGFGGLAGQHWRRLRLPISTSGATVERYPR